MLSEPPMPKRLLPFLPDPLGVVQIMPEPDRIVIHTAPRRRAARCPDCGAPSHRLHGHRRRRLADLPWQGRPVRLDVTVRRLLCLNPACRRRTFSEPLTGVAQPFARRSERLRDVQHHLGLARGGEPASCMAQRLAMPVSPDTLLRMVRSGPAPPRTMPRVIGIDEWAWRRGRRYGTMIVDLERNAVVDLLPDRDAGSVATWLQDHPGVEIFARDRGEIYGEGVRHGAPAARQVLDRWHLLCNLSTALQSVVARHHRATRSVARAILDECAETALALDTGERRPTATEERRRTRHASRQARHAELMRLFEAGTSIAGLARALGMDRKTVRRWLHREGPPLWRKPPRRTVLDPCHAYLERRWREGCRNAAELARELERLDAGVSPRVVRDWATRRRRTGTDALDAAPGSATSRWRPPSVNWTTRLLQADPETLAGEDARFVDRPRAEVPALARAVALAGRLARLLRRQLDEALETWLDEAGGTDLARFAASLRRDAEAVRGAIETRWSTSPVEGQISRLKMIKRQMFGHAGFDLLRQRVLHVA